MVNSNEIGQVPAVVNVPTAQVHPYAKRRFKQFQKELYDEVPLDKLENKDFTVEELTNLKKCTHEIEGWLGKCRMDAGEGSLMVYPYSSAVNYDMSNLKKLFKAVYERKIEKARQDAEEKERQAKQEMEIKRHQIALAKINPPIGDAKRFLTEAEYGLFVEGLPGAINAFLDGGKGCLLSDWKFDFRASDYTGCLAIIERRKQQESRRKQTELELSVAVKQAKAAVLTHSKKASINYPAEFEKYHPDGWCVDLELPTEEKIKNWAHDKVLTLIPAILTDFIRWHLSWKVWVTPHASYEVVGSIPALRWTFSAIVQVTVMLELEDGVQKGVQANACDLGTTTFTQPDWPITGTFYTPVAFLRMLVEGKQEIPGISVIESDEWFTTFSIQGCTEEVEVVDDFVNFIKDISQEKPLAEALLERGVINASIAELLKKKWGQDLPVANSSGTGTKDSAGEEADLVAALEAMGLKKAEIVSGMEAAQLSPGMTLEDKVKAVLQNTGM